MSRLLIADCHHSAGCCSRWVIYEAYAADQEAQRRAEEASKRQAAARKGGTGGEAAAEALLGTEAVVPVRHLYPHDCCS